MQFVQQGFELVVTDHIRFRTGAHGRHGQCRRRSDGRRHRRFCNGRGHDRGRHAVAMQLVEQGLELVVADEVGFAAGTDRCHGEDRRRWRGVENGGLGCCGLVLARNGIDRRHRHDVGRRWGGRRRGRIAEQVEQVVVEGGRRVHAACSVSRASVSSSQSSARR